ncbi:alpha/beta fold hydrolase [Umezawaea tangerina]|uniref:Pimeloyl-ACP methyl ester carboxylesterase n=1 Tax=Umezawaea tangerina TaxID=84725 RepID=A0A2T0SZW6_9PSEU|nr:alpha/beta hydrolase [Umezawaea tangerina]PRY38960.1 pimeloyl-ACP methyl ester carboxylesterase [Umezawaea tangerina]
MTVVFVHGVFETARLWDDVRSHLFTDSIAWELPGFGVPRPDGFGASMDDYVDWLVRELRGLGKPVDLVGHGWGALLVVRAVTLHPAAARSWTADQIGALHPEYAWPDAARWWQAGDAGRDRSDSSLERDKGYLALQFAAAGAPSGHVDTLCKGLTATSVRCAHDLYRSATPNVHAYWGAALSMPTRMPGLVLQPSLDAFDDRAMADYMAARLAARTQSLDGLGHWWMLERPKTARVLERFWNSVVA